MAKVEGMRGKDNLKPVFVKKGAPNIAPTFCNNNNNNFNNNNKRPNAGRDYAVDKKVKVEASGGSCGAGTTRGWHPERGRAVDEEVLAFFGFFQLAWTCGVCDLQVWCWLVSTVLWIVVVERQLDLSSVTARLRVMVLPIVVCRGGGTVPVVVVGEQCWPVMPTQMHCWFTVWKRSGDRAEDALSGVGEVAVAPSMGFSSDLSFWLLVRRGNHMRMASGAWACHRRGGWPEAHRVTEDRLFLPLAYREFHPRFLGEPGMCIFCARGVSQYVCTSEVCVVFLDTLTPEFELYVRLRERRLWVATCVCGYAVACSTPMVGGVVLVGLHCSLACGCGATIGPFVHDCETESCGFTRCGVPWWWHGSSGGCGSELVPRGS
ncbi:hypothetical protein Taro_054190, partial [Colocasia esculenta]|nr:hypothetical protein [Colocasia esculenta]